jgi:hypothetical protein
VRAPAANSPLNGSYAVAADGPDSPRPRHRSRCGDRVPESIISSPAPTGLVVSRHGQPHRPPAASWNLEQASSYPRPVAATWRKRPASFRRVRRCLPAPRRACPASCLASRAGRAAFRTTFASQQQGA